MARENEGAPSSMINLIHPHGLQIRLDTPKGRGVFATQKIPAGTVIDISPVLIMPAHESEKTVLAHYTYTWPAEIDAGMSEDPSDKSIPSSEKNPTTETLPQQAMALGLGSMFNHKRNPNVAWNRDIPMQVIRYFTLRDIQAGEELCISYGSKLWFQDTDAPDEDDSGDRTETYLYKMDIFE